MPPLPAPRHRDVTSHFTPTALTGGRSRGGHNETPRPKPGFISLSRRQEGVTWSASLEGDRGGDRSGVQDVRAATCNATAPATVVDADASWRARGSGALPEVQMEEWCGPSHHPGSSPNRRRRGQRQAGPAPQVSTLRPLDERARPELAQSVVAGVGHHEHRALGDGH